MCVISEYFQKMGDFMEKIIFILSVIANRSGFQIIALDLTTYEFIRIVDVNAEKYKGISEDVIVNNDIKAFDIMLITKLEPCPTSIHPEDYTICKSSSYTHKKNNNTFRSVHDIYDKCPKFDSVGILGNESHILPPDSTEFNHSIEMVSFATGKLNTTTSKYNGKAQTKTKFSFISDGVHYKDLQVLDPDEALEENESKAYLSGYVVVSFTEDIWSKKHGYNKYIAKIFHDTDRIDDRTPKKNGIARLISAVIKKFKKE